MNLRKAARAILSVTALAWSIPLAQAGEASNDVEETVAAEQSQGRATPGQAARRGSPPSAGTEDGIADE